MKILNEEVALREETRVLEQSRPQLELNKFEGSAESLSLTQLGLRDRTDGVIEKVLDLPEGEQKFRKELMQLANASKAMADAREILAEPETGSRAIAAETEAIEWLLMAKRSGKGGGGGGGSPGNGSRDGGTVTSSALALIGESEEKAANTVERETNQATGKSGADLPEEYRAGLDRYLEALDAQGSQ